jgi:hypothetical protein
MRIPAFIKVEVSQQNGVFGKKLSGVYLKRVEEQESYGMVEGENIGCAALKRIRIDRSSHWILVLSCQGSPLTVIESLNDTRICALLTSGPQDGLPIGNHGWKNPHAKRIVPPPPLISVEVLVLEVAPVLAKYFEKDIKHHYQMESMHECFDNLRADHSKQMQTLQQHMDNQQEQNKTKQAELDSALEDSKSAQKQIEIAHTMIQSGQTEIHTLRAALCAQAAGTTVITSTYPSLVDTIETMLGLVEHLADLVIDFVQVPNHVHNFVDYVLCLCKTQQLRLTKRLWILAFSALRD